jgi:hypothetical protein
VSTGGIPPRPAQPPSHETLAGLPPPVVSDRRTPCPRCGEVAEPGQEVCLRCGALVGRHYRRPPSWRLPAALAALGVLLIGAGVGFGVAELTHHKGSKKSAPVSLNPTAPSTPVPPPTTAPPKTITTAPPSTTTSTTPPPTTTPSGGANGSPTLTVWPSSTRGWTVVLLITNDKAKATARARDAARKAISAGVIHGSDYAGFNRADWIVFMGQYPKRDAAARAEKGYAAKGFSGTPRFIKPKT